MKSAQNAGSDLIVYGLGGLTTNNMSLVNTPTWGAAGIVFNGTTQYYTVPDFLNGTDIYSFTRMNTITPEATSNIAFIAAQWESSTNDRSVGFGTRASKETLPRSSDGTATGIYDATSAASNYAIDRTYVANFPGGGAPLLWRDKTSAALSLSSGTAQTSSYNTAVNISGINDSDGTAVFANGTKTAQAWVNAALTTAQRETITDLINAL